jgi:hypothetical protein
MLPRERAQPHLRGLPAMRSFEMDLAFVRVLADLVEAVEPPLRSRMR